MNLNESVMYADSFQLHSMVDDPSTLYQEETTRMYYPSKVVTSGQCPNKTPLSGVMCEQNSTVDSMDINNSPNNTTTTTISTANDDQTVPYAYIVEQPAKCGVRFRYECEGRISSAIPGASSTPSHITYPTIAVANYYGPVKVVVSCVTKQEPYRPHPHNLVGKKLCQQGICVAIYAEPYCQFNNLGILCAKRKDIKDRLRTREQLKVDPFHTGFGHKSQTFKLIDLSVVRLCFQVFLPDPSTGKFSIGLKPIVSDEIYDKKAMSELNIIKLSHYSAPATGGQTVIMLCERVLKDDIQIRFYQTNQHGTVVWEKLADFNSSDIHKHFAITFRVPSFEQNGSIVESQQEVNVQLVRPSDGCSSEPVLFYYNFLYDDPPPIETSPTTRLSVGKDLCRKRKRINTSGQQVLTQNSEQTISCGNTFAEDHDDEDDIVDVDEDVDEQDYRYQYVDHEMEDKTKSKLIQNVNENNNHGPKDYPPPLVPVVNGNKEISLDFSNKASDWPLLGTMVSKLVAANVSGVSMCTAASNMTYRQDMTSNGTSTGGGRSSFYDIANSMIDTNPNTFKCKEEDQYESNKMLQNSCSLNMTPASSGASSPNSRSSPCSVTVMESNYQNQVVTLQNQYHHYHQQQGYFDTSSHCGDNQIEQHRQMSSFPKRQQSPSNNNNNPTTTTDTANNDAFILDISGNIRCRTWNRTF